MALDVMLRNGFGLSVADAGADLALVALSGIVVLAIEESGSPKSVDRTGPLLSSALLELVGWVFCLWLLSKEPGRFTAGLALGIGAFALLWFFRECRIILERGDVS